MDRRERERERINVGWEKKAVLLLSTESILEALRDRNLDLLLSCLRPVAQLNEQLMPFAVMCIKLRHIQG